MARVFAVAGACFGATGVALGAFGAHALRGRIPERLLETWETAVLYQLLHALALLLVAVLVRGAPPRGATALSVAGGGFLAGVVLFSGSLYVLCLTGATWLGPVTPLGGVAFITGWVALAIACWSRRD